MNEPEVAIDPLGDIWILVPNSLIAQFELGPGVSWVRHGAPINEIHSSTQELANATGGIDLYARHSHVDQTQE